ncbi:MAG: phosphoribosylamine--glycine ligase [Candidatus Rokubacteria bacterium]|nr:phosphoribosylamine--glycine ligase [Candidatus Rokubacteria bacterium]
MKVLLVGGGGRENALAWAIRQSPLVDELYAAPGNPGIARHAKCLPIAVDAADELVALAERERVDFTIIGPEVPLVAGVADHFAERGQLALWPGRAGAMLEGSKAFAKDLMARHGVPTAAYRTFTEVAEARRYCRTLGAPVVVKASGLAAGKGAIVCGTLGEADEALALCMERRAFGDAGTTVVVEEFLRGEEASLFALVNGETAVLLGSAQDHKTVFDGDRGPNTGGMGAYSPVPSMDAALERRVMDEIVRPTLAGLAADRRRYRGVLFVGLMLTPDGPKVIEFNCRWGDPECQVIVPRLGEDLVPLLLAAARGESLPARVTMRPDATVCVTLASGGYPGAYRTGLAIEGLEAAERGEGVRVFHAGTAERDGRLVTSGGRVLSVTATAPRLPDAIARAYAAVGKIRFEGMHYRRDIGKRALPRQEE